MEHLVQNIISVPLNYVIIALVTIFYTLEQVLHQPHKSDKKQNHFLNNILFQIVIFGVSYLFAVLQVFCIQWINNNHWGLLNQFEIPFGFKAVVGVACFDFAGYWMHRYAHKSQLLWKLHRVHHSDTMMDCSTFFRHHPLEVIVAGTSAIVASALFGLSTTILGIYIFILIPFMIMQHTSIKFPRWTDSIFGKIFITPNIHKVHHAQDQYYTDSNFADIFIFWDKLFGTYKYLPAEKIDYGLAEFTEEKKQTFWFLMKSIFLKIDRITNDKVNKTN